MMARVPAGGPHCATLHALDLRSPVNRLPVCASVCLVCMRTPAFPSGEAPGAGNNLFCWKGLGGLQVREALVRQAVSFCIQTQVRVSLWCRRAGDGGRRVRGITRLVVLGGPR
jgi:hypothetical protein